MWVKLDDKLHSHPKVGSVNDRALGLHLRALSYCGDQLTDGHLPEWWVTRNREDAEQVAELVAAGLWHTTPEGYRIHDFLDLNPTRESVLEEREKAKNRRQKGARNSRTAQKQGASPDVRPNVARTSGAPTRPDPTLNSSGSASQTPVDEVFAEWVTATERAPGQTKLTPERRRVIEKALSSHGLDDCLLAVRRIGADKHGERCARNGYGRGHRLDDIEHALKGAKRIEQWRDRVPTAAPVDRDEQVLNQMMGAGQ